MMRSLITKAIIFTFSVLFGIVFFIVSFTPYGSIVRHPQYLGTKEKIVVSLEKVSIDGIPTELVWTASLGGPKPFFGGARVLWIHGSNEILDVDLTVLLDANEPFVSNIIINRDGKRYGGDDSNGHFICGGQAGTGLYMPLKNANAHFSVLNQRWKHLKMHGEISVPETEISHNPDECYYEKLDTPLTFGIDNLQLNADSELIYVWSSKGGATYEL